VSAVPPPASSVTHEFECPIHGRFDSRVPFGDSPPKSRPCKAMVPHGKPSRDHGQTTMMCRENSLWVPPTVGVVWVGGKPSEQR